ncbi:23S rRNA (guanosine(2251)-2'-O)-methyltransferase RlmB [Caviibacter abscessus]|uniref:23S rRNA (guanosine(2251)-2'-O)-methyltransferase RlmB n=1 Tax=Caviibacter abscessus TaxID=1766719 RepID=UPI0008360D1A|nr:23S rRNA (guanosine(2251)-2'-O)-methyltransferase RlmB [Caviibacter abscessus]
MDKIIGINPVTEVLKTSKNIEKLEVFKGIKKESIKEILRLASSRNIKIFYTNKRENNSQGVVAYITDYNYNISLESLLEKELKKEKSVIVILDQIQDPRNFGAILRSCECFGVGGVIIQDRNNVRVTETVVKSSAGAIEYVDITEVTNISDTIDKLKKYGYFVYGTAADGEYLYSKIDYPDKVAIVLGNEGSGMRKKVREHCDTTLKIHLKGVINSLNVSVACGILLSQISK